MPNPGAWEHSGALTANLVPGVGHLMILLINYFVKSLVFPHLPQGQGMGGERLSKKLKSVVQLYLISNTTSLCTI